MFLWPLRLVVFTAGRNAALYCGVFLVVRAREANDPVRPRDRKSRDGAMAEQCIRAGGAQSIGEVSLGVLVASAAKPLPRVASRKSMRSRAELCGSVWREESPSAAIVQALLQRSPRLTGDGCKGPKRAPHTCGGFGGDVS